MKYFITQATRNKGEADAVAVTVKTDLKEARMLFHQILASAYASATLEFAEAQVLNEYGAVELVEQYHEEEPEPNA